MKTTRTKGGHLTTVAPPTTKAHGRPLAMTPAVRARIEPGDAASRYAVACVERTIARLRGETAAYKNAKRRAERARAELSQEEGGPEERIRRVNVALGNSGPALRSAVKASVPMRDYAVGAVLGFMAIAREHDIRTTAGLSRAFSAAAWGELESMLRDLVFEVGPTRKVFADLVKLAASCEASARHALGWALAVEEKARAARREADSNRTHLQWTAAALAAEQPSDAPEATEGPEARVEIETAPEGEAGPFAADEEEEPMTDHAGAEEDVSDTRLSLTEPRYPDGLVWPDMRISPHGVPFSRPNPEAVIDAWHRGLRWDNARDRFVERLDFVPAGDER